MTLAVPPWCFGQNPDWGKQMKELTQFDVLGLFINVSFLD
jgi:hypothetical protein